MRVVIADDEPLARALLRCMLEELPDIEIVDEAESGAAALDRVAASRPDILFLDISMPGRSGIHAAIDIIPLQTDVIFVTAHEEFAVDAFELGAIDYLLKPVRRPRLIKALERARERRRARQAEPSAASNAMPPAPAADDAEDIFWVPGRNGTARVPIAAIQRIEAARDHVYLHTAERTYFYRCTMASMQQRLASSGMVRVHRSAFIRPDAVTTIYRRGKATTLGLADNVMIPVGPSYRAGALARITGAVEK